jgi:hypothetical protein
MFIVVVSENQIAKEFNLSLHFTFEFYGALIFNYYAIWFSFCGYSTATIDDFVKIVLVSTLN